MGSTHVHHAMHLVPVKTLKCNRAPRPENLACPVCRDEKAKPFMTVNARRYWRCQTCEATFLEPRQRPRPDAEHAHYLQHQNDPDDPGYRGFLAKLAQPLLSRLAPGSSGLDYGCGPGPALASMMRDAGHSMALYDPFFAPDPASLSGAYDFVTCSETAEHFHDPAREFDRLDGLLQAGGWLGVMTCFQTDDARFVDWHYRRDPTHVVFYRAVTFHHLAAQRGWHCEIPIKDVALMRKA